MGAEPYDGGMEQIRNYDIAMDKKDTISTTVALSRSLDSFITGIADVEKHIGRDFVFHDAEEDSVNIDRGWDGQGETMDVVTRGLREAIPCRFHVVVVYRNTWC